MGLRPGIKLGGFEILSLLGKGGMGEVYRARDSKLKRDVAIKVLPDNFSRDLERALRFQREAEILASLNHPHIAAIYQVEEVDSSRLLILEFVEGETLADRLNRGRMPLDEILTVATQVAEALEAAHERGIVHRDVKPGNIKITPGGVVKVLDFGLAKVGNRFSANPDPDSPTVTVDGTQQGTIVGTVVYMSPEQARGKPVDKRTDIWSFGCVLYEMLTGRVPFAGETTSDTIAAIIEREPVWNAIPGAFGSAVRRILHQCLEKDSKRRFRDIGDVRIELEQISEDQGNRQAQFEGLLSRPKPPRRLILLRWAIGLAALVAVVSITVRFLHTPATPENTLRLNFSLENSPAKISGFPVPAPDGSAVVYPGIDSEGRLFLWVRALDAEEPRALPGTDGALQPFWSPDGRWVAFFAQGRLKKVSRDGTNIQTITSLPDFFGGAWSSTGEILLTPGNRSPIFRVPDSGGMPQQLTKLDDLRAENSHRHITFLPDGRHFLFVARSSSRDNNALYAGFLDSGEIRRVAHIESNVAYVPARDGREAMLLFARDGKLYQQAFNGTELRGDAVAVREVNYGAIGVQGDFALSLNGRLLVTRPPLDTQTQLTWVDSTGKVLGTLGTPGTYQSPVISPDGSRVIFNRPDDNGGNRDVWSMDTTRGVASRLTVSPDNEWNNVWAPDGRGLIFASDRGGNRLGRMFHKTSLDAGAEEAAVPGLPEFANPEDWSLDGRWIIFSHGGSHGVIWIAPTFGERKPFQFLKTSFEERIPRFSPDAKWISYHSNESGRFEVYVRPFSGGTAASTGKVQISERGGFYGTWSRDGKQMFFIGGDSKLYAAAGIDALNRGAVSPPRALFEVCPGNTPTGAATQGRSFDVGPDGRFLFVCGSEQQSHYSVFVNWQPK